MLQRFVPFAALALLLATAGSLAPATSAVDCPEGGHVRFGVEPYETGARLLPVYDALGKLLGDKIGCPVDIFVATSYNAEIEAMRAGKLEIGEFGPLGYVLAHQVAGAEAFATFNDKNGNPSTYTASIVTWNGSGIKTLADVKGKTFAFSDPDSTSGHLFPAYALSKAGIDPEKDITPLYAGSHTASFEAIRNHKVEAGELNSTQITAATLGGEYAPADFPTLWQSSPIPNDPIALRGSLSPELKKRLSAAVFAVEFSDLPPDAVKVLPVKFTTKFVPQTDAAYNQIRDLVSTLHIDLNALH
jgi:phosphonate transport system substrate-binding protein